MRKIKKLINGIRIRYYDNLMGRCIDNWDIARLKYDESHKKCTKWIKLYDKCENKLHKIPRD